MNNPSIILTSQFTVPGKANFTKYVEYCTRKTALLEKKTLTIAEQNELSALQYSIDTYEMSEEKDIIRGRKKGGIQEIEGEASAILASPSSFQNDNEFEKYIAYMGRQYALESKQKLATTEEEELHLLQKKIDEYNQNSSDEYPVQQEILAGVFSKDKDFMKGSDVEDTKEIFRNAENSGSIYYQDVISFDTDFLEQQQIYNRKTDVLDEQKIKQASKEMMKQLCHDESINEDNVYWFASIHRNTEHIHIHFGTIEKENMRPMIVTKRDGKEFYEPKGLRKQTTIDNMKSTFTNSLINRDKELSRISDLRNIIVKDVRENYRNGQTYQPLPREEELLMQIRNELPSNKKYWSYSSKQVSNETREKMDELTSLLMNDNKYLAEFKRDVKKESDYRIGLYGDTKRDNKDYYQNKMVDMNKRMGNALLKEMKEMDKEKYLSTKKKKQVHQTFEQINKSTKASPIGDRNTKMIHQPFQRNTQQDGLNKQKKRLESSYVPYQKASIKKKDIRRLSQVIDDDLNKYRAAQEHEEMQRRIAYEQQRRMER